MPARALARALLTVISRAENLDFRRGRLGRALDLRSGILRSLGSLPEIWPQRFLARGIYRRAPQTWVGI